MKRRRALQLSALGAASLAVSCRKDDNEPTPPDGISCADEDFEALIQSIIAATAGSYLDLGLSHLDGGGNAETLLSASFHAGVRGLRIFPGSSHHGTMVVNSAALVRQEELVPAFWGLWFVETL